jgi:hypothetical protein
MRDCQDWGDMPPAAAARYDYRHNDSFH